MQFNMPPGYSGPPLGDLLGSHTLVRDTFCSKHQEWLDNQPPRPPCWCNCPGPQWPWSDCSCSCHSNQIPRAAAVAYFLVSTNHLNFLSVVETAGLSQAFLRLGCPACYIGEDHILEIEEGDL